MKTYESPELELVSFETEDVLTASFASLQDFLNACQRVNHYLKNPDFPDCPDVYVCDVVG